MKSSTKDNAEGRMHQVKGKIKETAGKVAGNNDLEAGQGREGCAQVERRKLKISRNPIFRKFKGRLYDRETSSL